VLKSLKGSHPRRGRADPTGDLSTVKRRRSTSCGTGPAIRCAGRPRLAA